MELPFIEMGKVEGKASLRCITKSPALNMLGLRYLSDSQEGRWINESGVQENDLGCK